MGLLQSGQKVYLMGNTQVQTKSRPWRRGCDQVGVTRDGGWEESGREELGLRTSADRGHRGGGKLSVMLLSGKPSAAARSLTCRGGCGLEPARTGSAETEVPGK